MGTPAQALSDADAVRALVGSARDLHPPFLAAVRGDAEITAAYRGERHQFRSGADATVQALRLALVADAFLAQVFYRAKASLQRRRVPVLPHLFHRLAIINAGVCIGDPVVIEPGLYLAHGQVVIDGVVRIKRGVAIFPWVTIGLRPPALMGATIDESVHIGTGAKVLGEVHLGRRCRVGANAVVVDDVPADRVAVGIPARVTAGEPAFERDTSTGPDTETGSGPAN